jgi:hypothetical protein
VRHVHDRHALGFQLGDQIEQQVDLARLERRRRLVHDDDAGVGLDRPGDRHHLLDAQAELAERALHVRGDPVPLERVAGLAVHPLEVERPEPGRLAAQEEVPGDAQLRRQVHLLVDGGDPGPLCAAGRVEGHVLAPQLHRSTVQLIHAGDQLDQRRLTGTVLTDQRVHRAREQLDRDILEGTYPGEPFTGRRDLENGAAGHRRGHQ